jgi:pectate lyase
MRNPFCLTVRKASVFKGESQGPRAGLMLSDRIKKILLAFTQVFLSVYIVLNANGMRVFADIPYQGFGAKTQGGLGQVRYHVTNLNDSGPGSLRDALSQGRRYIVFKVGGEISLQSPLSIGGPYLTIDGSTAPSPGITIKNYGLKIDGSKEAHDIVVHGLRVRIVNDRYGKEDGIAVGAGAYNVVIDHVSVCCASDENIAIVGNNTRDVTVSWSLLVEPREFHPTNMLIAYEALRTSIHHNIFMKARRRNPWINYSRERPAPEIQADVRNNLMWDVSAGSTNHGTVVFWGGKANVVNNYYKAILSTNPNVQKRAIVVCKESNQPEDMEFCYARGPAAGVYVAGNISQDGWTEHINGKGTETRPFPAPFVVTQDACTAAHDVLSNAGVRPLDPLDQRYLASVLLPPCRGGEMGR